MTRKELSIELAASTGITSKAANEILGTAIDIMAGALMRGEAVTLRGLGTFEARLTKPKKVHNFHTGATQMLQTRRRVHFKCSRTLNEDLRPGTGFEDLDVAAGAPRLNGEAGEMEALAGDVIDFEQ